MKKIILGVGCLVMATTTVFANPYHHLDTSKEQISNAVNKAPSSVMATAISKGEVDFIAKSLEYGADPNERVNGRTLLMYAARYNKTDIMELLIQNGADLNAKCSQGKTALDYAKLSNAKEAIEILSQVK